MGWYTKHFNYYFALEPSLAQFFVSTWMLQIDTIWYPHIKIITPVVIRAKWPRWVVPNAVSKRRASCVSSGRRGSVRRAWAVGEGPDMEGRCGNAGDHLLFVAKWWWPGVVYGIGFCHIIYYYTLFRYQMMISGNCWQMRSIEFKQESSMNLIPW